MTTTVEKTSKAGALRKDATHMANMFRRYMAGEVHQKTMEHKTGRINTGNLWAYKIKDDIFLRSETKPVGLNHGVSILIDASGSMSGSKIEYASRETLRLLYFCRQLGIPYQVFAFEGGNFWPVISTYLPKLATNKLLVQLENSYNYSGSILRAGGGTPLESSLRQMIPLIEMFQEDNRIDIHNFFLLTDGLSGFRHNTYERGYRRYPINDYGDFGQFSGVIAYLKVISDILPGNNFWFHIEERRENGNGFFNDLERSQFFRKALDRNGEKFYSGNKLIGVDGVAYQSNFRRPSKAFMNLLAEMMNKRRTK